MKLEQIVNFDKYFWIARIFPAIITLIPFYIFQYFYLDNLILKELKNLERYSLLFHSLIIMISLYFAALITRSFGKDLIENFYFIKNNKLPTTQILLGKKKVFSNQTLTNLKNKIKSDFKIDLNSKGKEKLLRIKDAVDQIRIKVGYKHKILNQYNTEYGFFRNLTGGFIIYIPTTILLILFAYFNNKILFSIGITMLSVELIYLLFSWKILDNYGTKYAKQLFNLYISEVKE